jgi:hypothetical protein
MRTDLVQARRHFDHLRELAVLLVALAHVAGVDAVLAERLGHGRMVGQQAVAVVVEVADQRHGMPMRSSCSRMCGTASAASGVLTVMRTSSLPAWPVPSPGWRCR